MKKYVAGTAIAIGAVVGLLVIVHVLEPVISFWRFGGRLR